MLGTYSHEFDAKRRSVERRAALEERYGGQDGYLHTLTNHHAWNKKARKHWAS